MNWSLPSGLFDIACSESPAGGVTGMSWDPVLGSLVLLGVSVGNVSVTPGRSWVGVPCSCWGAGPNNSRSYGAGRFVSATLSSSP